MFPLKPLNDCHPVVPVPQPPRLEELHAEQTYLLDNLHQENIKAMELLRKLPALEEVLLQSQSSAVCRRTRKQMRKLRYRINETTGQETTIMNRLNQLAQEIQSRKGWTQIENQQLHYGSLIGYPPAPICEMQQLCISPINPNVRQEYPFLHIPFPERHQNSEEISWEQSSGDQVSEVHSNTFSPTNPQNTHLQYRTSEPDACTNSLMGWQRSTSLSSLDKELHATKLPEAATMKESYSTRPGHSNEIALDNETIANDGSRDDGSGSPVPQYCGYYLKQ